MRMWLAALVGTIVVTPVGAPEVVWDRLDLDQQIAFLQAVRPDPPPPAPVMPVVYRRAPAPQPPEFIDALIGTYFKPEDHEWARRVMWCESRFDAHAKNPSSSASGLFQHLARFWEDRSSRAGWAGASIWDPEANVAVAAWLFYTGGPEHWVCK